MFIVPFKNLINNINQSSNYKIPWKGQSNSESRCPFLNISLYPAWGLNRSGKFHHLMPLLYFMLLLKASKLGKAEMGVWIGICIIS